MAPLAFVLVQGSTDVKVDQRIATQHQSGLVKKTTEVLDAAHAAGRAKRFGDDLALFAHTFVGVANLHTPAVTVAKILLDLVVVKCHVHHDLGDAVAGQMFDQVLHHRFAQNRDHRFGQVLGQRAYPGALACGQNHAFSHAVLLGVFSFALPCPSVQACTIAVGIAALPAPAVLTHGLQLRCACQPSNSRANVGSAKHAATSPARRGEIL
jgi:hypothetical protein